MIAQLEAMLRDAVKKYEECDRVITIVLYCNQDKGGTP